MATRVIEEMATDAQPVATPPSRNGTGPRGPAMPKRTRTITLPDEYGDAGMTLKIWINYPNRLADDVFGNNDEEIDGTFQEHLQAWLDKPEPGSETLNGERKIGGVRYRDQRGRAARLFRESDWPAVRGKLKDERRIAALQRIVLEHNGWWDPEEERPYPSASDPAFWRQISNELVLVIFTCVGTEIRQLSKDVSAERESQT